jgi:hypothetical protein
MTARTTIPTSDEYLDLVTSFHRPRARFSEVIRQSVSPFVAAGDLLAGLPEKFDLDLAIGAQLDVVGEWIGRDRNIQIPLVSTWFAFDYVGQGFDEGAWKGDYDPEWGIYALDDDTYRALLRAKIAANNWDGTAAGMAEGLSYLFQTSGTNVFAATRNDVALIVGIAGIVPGLVPLAIVYGGYVPFKPAGVAAEYLVSSINGTALFSFDAAGSEYAAGFDAGSIGIGIDKIFGI